MIIRIHDRVELSIIYSTRAHFHKYYVAMKYRCICIFFYFERTSIFKYASNNLDLAT